MIHSNFILKLCTHEGMTFFTNQKCKETKVSRDITSTIHSFVSTPRNQSNLCVKQVLIMKCSGNWVTTLPIGNEHTQKTDDFCSHSSPANVPWINKLNRFMNYIFKFKYGRSLFSRSVANRNLRGKVVYESNIFEGKTFDIFEKKNVIIQFW